MPTMLALELLSGAQKVLLFGGLAALFFTTKKLSLLLHEKLYPPYAIGAPAFAISGVICASVSPAVLLIYSGGLWAISMFFSAPTRPVLQSIICCGAIAGAALITQQHYQENLSFLLRDKAHTITGVVIEKEPWSRTKNGCILSLSIGHIGKVLTSFSHHGCIRCYLYTTPNCSVGSAIRAYRIQLVPEKNRTWRQRAQQLRSGTIGTLFAPNLSYTQLDDVPLFSWWRPWHDEQRTRIYFRLKEQLSPQAFAFMSALFFGNKSFVSFPQLRRLFNRWGITHYLARSGLHIMLIIMLWTLFLSVLPLTLTIKTVLLGALIICYSMFSWASISFWRALLLWLFYVIAFFAKRLPQPIFLLSILTLFIVVISPANSMCLDFQLSFFLTMTLMLIGYYQQR